MQKWPWGTVIVSNSFVVDANTYYTSPYTTDSQAVTLCNGNAATFEGIFMSFVEGVTPGRAQRHCEATP